MTVKGSETHGFDTFQPTSLDANNFIVANEKEISNKKIPFMRKFINLND